MHQVKPLIRMWRRIKRLLQDRNLALEEEEIEIRPRTFMRSYQSNETTELQKQPPIEEPSTQKDPSLIDLPATNNQPMPPIPSSKEKKPNFIPICNQGEFLMEPKEIKQDIALETNC